MRIKKIFFIGALILFLNGCSKKNSEPSSVTQTTDSTIVNYSATASLDYQNLCNISVKVKFTMVDSGLIRKGFVIGATPKPKTTSLDILTISEWEPSDSVNSLIRKISDYVTHYNVDSSYYIRPFLEYPDSTVYGNEVLLVFKYIVPTSAPVVATNTVNNYYLDGTITNMIGTLVTDFGCVIGKTPNPTINNALEKVSRGAVFGLSCDSLININTYYTLPDDGLYYYRAYAINSAGVSYGNEIGFNYTGSRNKNLIIKYGIPVDTVIATYQASVGFLYSIGIKNHLLLPQGIHLYVVIRDIEQEVLSNFGYLNVGDSIEIKPDSTAGFTCTANVAPYFTSHCYFDLKIVGVTTDPTYYCKFSIHGTTIGNTHISNTYDYISTITGGTCSTH